MEESKMAALGIVAIALIGIICVFAFVQAPIEAEISYKGTYMVGQPIARYYVYGSDNFYIFYYGMQNSEALFTVLVSGGYETGKATFQFTMPKGSTLMIAGEKYKIGTFNSSEITLE